MERQLFIKLVHSIPYLTDLGIDSKLFYDQQQLHCPPSNSHLLSDEGFNAFKQCVEWLKKYCLPNKTVTANAPTSRTLQQIAKKRGYVSNGAMIAAIVYLGFPYKVQTNSPNVLVGVSRRSPCFDTICNHHIQKLFPPPQSRPPRQPHLKQDGILLGRVESRGIPLPATLGAQNSDAAPDGWGRGFPGA